MNLKHLETFHVFCQFVNMSETAEFLSISQPAVSQQLRNFESECGVKLFYREANKYRLTDVGESIYLLSKRIFCRIEQVDELLEKARINHADRLRIGSTKTYAQTAMPDLLAEFQDRFPGVQLRLSEGNSSYLLGRLRNRKEDLVVVARSEYDSSLRAIPFAQAEFILVTRPDHRLAQGGPHSIKSLSGERLILREHGSGSRNAILAKLSKHDVQPSVVIESESRSFILEYIERKMGISFLLLREIDKELESGMLKRIDLLEGNVTLRADIVTRRNEPLSVPARYFVKLAKELTRLTAD